MDANPPSPGPFLRAGLPRSNEPESEGMAVLGVTGSRVGCRLKGPRCSVPSLRRWEGSHGHPNPPGSIQMERANFLKKAGESQVKLDLPEVTNAL